MPSLAPLSKSRRRSEASLVLERLGVCQARLAEALEVSASSLSRMLGARQPLPVGFEAVLRAAVGPEDARQVVAAIGGAR